MAFTPSIGDIMMLSSLAWKIGRCFTSGRAGAPAEFREVENELESLKASVTLLADTLDTDDSILFRAHDKTQDGLAKILYCCRETLESLESLVNQYQELRKPVGDGGATQRVWKSSFIRNYKKIYWTTEGGDIQALRNMLQMHINSISLTMKAIQSNSLSRLEKTIEPMADKVDELHATLIGGMDDKIAEIHSLMVSMATSGTSPWLGPQRMDTSLSMADTLISELHATRKESQSSQERKEADYLYKHSCLENIQRTAEPTDSELSSTAPPAIPRNRQARCSDHRRNGSNDETFHRWSAVSDELSDQNIGLLQSPRLTPSRRPSTPLRPLSFPALLPPVVESTDRIQDISKVFGDTQSPLLQRKIRAGFTISDEPEDGEGPPPKFAITASEQAAFELDISNDAAVHCEARGSRVEYTEPDESKDDFRMVEASSKCKISVITKRHGVSTGNMRYVTSIWVLSNDRKVRLQQKLADGQEIIPYTVWGNEVKVVIRVDTELRYCGITPKDKPLEIAKTTWINYVFEDEGGATLFQNALMGKRLLHSLGTRRTLRTHDNLVTNAFTFQEQLCGLENLRLWSEDDGDGSVLAMIQYSANFRDGYLAFRLKGPCTTVQVRDDGDKWVRIKGLNVSFENSIDKKALHRRPSSDAAKAAKAKIDKNITGVKIEFGTTAEKHLFLEQFKTKAKTTLFG